jgi:hypothetical protein
MKSEKVLFFIKIFHRSLRDTTVLSQRGGRLNGGGEALPKPPGVFGGPGPVNIP